MPKNNKRDIEFLFEIGALRFMPRQWQRFLGPRFANITEHHFRVAWIALIIATHEGQTNTDKILKMALVHDIAESRTGDVDYIARQYVQRDEEQGIKDMLAHTLLHDEFVALAAEYESHSSIEAQIVKDADNLDVDLELREQAVSGPILEAVFTEGRDRAMQKKLYTQTAKTMMQEIRKANPHDWHALSPRNRLNGGDWKQAK